MVNPTWRVDSHHVNVGNGDCSIHVLVYVPQGLAYKCILLDGGSAWMSLDPKTGVAPQNPLTDMIPYLGSQYTWANGRCQFDTIVLSHWDEDHYGNLLQILRVDAALNAGIISYLKYDANNAPATYFYTPNWLADSGSRLNGAPLPYLTAHQGYAWINISYVPRKKTTVFNWVRFCILRTPEAGMSSVLGAEFFSNTLCTIPLTQITKLSDLAQANRPTNPPFATDTVPSMYCIGVYQTVLGPPPALVIKEDPTKTNKVSIVCILYWTDTQKISHYLAGDADQDTEANILKWLKKGHSGLMTSIKLSHHGSRSSTPLNLLQTAKPKNVFMSTPSGMHIHPSVEIVWYLWLWAVASQSNPAVLGTKYPHYTAVQPMDTPTYSNPWKYTKAHRVSVASFEEWNQNPYLPYSNACKALTADVNRGAPQGQGIMSLLDLYLTLKAKWKAQPNDMKPFIVNQLEQIWQGICHPSQTSHPSVGQGWVWPSAAAITTKNQIEAVVIRCSNDVNDGSVLHKYRGLPMLFPYQHSTKQSIYPTPTVGTAANAAIGPTYPFPPNFAPASGSGPAPEPHISTADGTAADIQSFNLNSCVVVTGRDADPPGTDPNEDEPDDGDFGNNMPPFPPRFRRVDPKTLIQDDGGYYLYSSVVPPQSITVAAAQYTILSAGPLNTFLSALHCANLCLSGPSPPGPTGVTQLLASDEFGLYLMTALQGQSMSIINAPAPYVGGFSFVAAPISGSSTDKALLSFTTTAVEDAFGLAKGSGPPLGVLEESKTLVFGLDTSVWKGVGEESATATLAQLVEFADITYLVQSPAVVFLSAIDLVITDPATGKRNAVWFEPLSSYRTTTRLEMDLSSDAVTELEKYISAFPGLSILSAFVIARKTSTWAQAPPAQGTAASSSITYNGSLTFGGDFVFNSTHFDTAIELQSNQITLVLVLRDKLDILADIFSALQPVLGLQGDHFEFLDWLKNTAGNTSFELPYLRRIVVIMDNELGSKGGTSSTPGLASVQIDLETRVNFSSGAFAIFLITYIWTREGGGTSSNTLTAGLWTLPRGSTTVAQQLLPSYEEYYSLMPPVTLNPGEQLPPSLDLRQLGGFDDLPSEIDPEVTRASLTIGSGGVSFNGDVVAGAPNGDIPKVSLSQLFLNVSYLFEPSDGFTGSLVVMAQIQAAPGAKNSSPAQITGEVFYDGSTWKLGAVVYDLYASTLYQFFNSDTQGGIGKVLDNLEIRELAIEYDYQPSGGASSFAISGDIAFGTLTLALSFTCVSSSSWEFKACLDTSQVPPTGTKLGDVLSHIFGPDVEDDLPSFILGIPINPPRSEDAVGFDMVSVAGPPGSTDSGLFFTAWLQFQDMLFQALQYQGPTPVGGNARPPPRRVFTMIVNALPTANIPLIGALAQPFDEMLLMYIQPQTGDGAGAGITHGDLKIINEELANAGRIQLPYKVTKQTYAATDVVLPIGAHFILVLKDSTGQPQVALDYVFYSPSTPVTEGITRAQTKLRKEEAPAIVKTQSPVAVTEDVQDTSQNPGVAKAPYSKKIGPLTISNMGFKYSGGSEPTLSIVMDASVVLGPIGMALLGFSLDVQFTQGITLYQLPEPGVSLAGLAVSFDKPPVNLAGLLEHVVVDKAGPPPVHLDYYQGGITLSFQPYLFQADGFYGKVTSAAGSFKSAFVYFILGGPLVTLEIAEITDVTGGFGYNSNLQFPTITTVVQFPFLQTASSTNPSTALTKLMNSGWFSPQDGSFWLAAGFRVIAFELLQASVVAVVEWNPDLYIGLFGVATVDMPTGTGSAKLLHVELGIVATVDFKNGVVKIEGQLAPSSFVLDPACHLTGGFALYQWFGGSSATALAPSDGDFVFTVGGYHRGFTSPAQYPNPPRLAISWSLDSALSIKGEAYFAITPSVCMAGGRLDASLSLGPLSAWFDAYADMLINYKPFFFTADGGISVGVGFALDLWICTIHISCEIAANLHLQGPPLSGTVYVDFWVFGFSIDFGNQSGGNDNPLLLTDFYNLALQADLPQQSSSVSSSLLAGQPVAEPDDASLPCPHVYTCNEGLIPSGTAASTPSSSDTPWNVRGAVFQFTVGCKFAIDTATIVTAQSDPNLPAIPPFDVPLTGNPVYAKPMQLTKPLSSTLLVTITPPPGTSPKQARWDACTGVVKTVPKALWGLCKPAPLLPPLPLAHKR
ncbi:hypothetical protein N0V88_004887 [Collariella sp. IMI 366227]|nr:hypothetical protein N0V88_004887 [Collariella sp. IMI 366227]